MEYEGRLLVCVSTEFVEPIRSTVEATRERRFDDNISTAMVHVLIRGVRGVNTGKMQCTPYDLGQAGSC